MIPNSDMIWRTIQFTKLESGPTTTTKALTTGATVMANLSGAEIAQLLGRTSAKITRSRVMVRVATATPESPKIDNSTLVASAEARMLTRLLPISSAPISRSRRSMSVLTVPARRSPLISSECMRARDAAVSAVSEPEKNPDKPMRTRMARMVRP